jgi:hypothetical protein
LQPWTRLFLFLPSRCGHSLTLVTLHEKVRWTTPPEKYLETYLEDVQRIKTVPDSPDATPFAMTDIAASACNVSICYYLVNRKAEAAKYGRETVKAIIEYFYGNWTRRIPTDLGTLDPEWWRVHSGWIEWFRYGLCWSSAVGDWEAARRIAEYPPDNDTYNPGYTKEDEAAYLALAKFVRGGPRAACAGHFATIAQRKKEKPKLLAAVIQAVTQNNKAKFQTALEAYLLYFREREFRSRELDKLLCFDGTTLLYIGRKRGLEFRIPPELNDHIIQLGGPAPGQ